MKRKKIGSSVYLLALLLFIILFFIKEFGLFTDSNINSAVPLPANLHPVVEERSQKLIQQAAKKGIVIVITDGFRSAEEQNRLYEKGRTAGGNVVTYAKGGESYHNFGLAVDFALKTQSGNVIWDMQYDGNQNGKADWAEVVQMAKTLGFEWGGDWAQFKDYPHLQMDFGLTIAELQQGERPPGDSSLVADTN
ncbi:M15 family metallopeptidase [Neobacillus mesonae]|uniref:Peptidase M15 n=1 Tax=Neobacillus mesonae TaxID=1193713 RepID=A0A3T0HU42_9BACI|nr:M15 family metallopeptidase [Neobacillus mesonae]AZU60652.1 peptidase M15 [Neobacillus mesonae]